MLAIPVLGRGGEKILAPPSVAGKSNYKNAQLGRQVAEHV